MDYISIFLGFPIEILQRHCIELLKGVMYQSGNGFKNTNHKRFQPREKRLSNLSLMKLSYRLALNTYGKHLVSTDGGTWYPLQTCRFLKVDYHVHSSLEKSLIERTMQYIKDRTIEGFDDYFPCKKKQM
jgi:hypothetical protein